VYVFRSSRALCTPETESNCDQVSRIYQPQPIHPMSGSTPHEASMGPPTPKTRHSNESPDISASPSPSSSLQPGTPSPQQFQQTENDIYGGSPGILTSERPWGLNPPSIRQQSSPLAYGSVPPFPSNFVREGIAPHEHILPTAMSTYPGSSSSSSQSVLQPVAGLRSPTAQESDGRCKLLIFYVTQLFSLCLIEILLFWQPRAHDSCDC
jgi:hypothetical protein